MRIRTTLLTLGLTAMALWLAACSRPLGPQESCNFVQNPELQRVSWKGRFPIKMYLHKSVPVQAYAAIDRAIAQYNTQVGGGRELMRIEARGVDGELSPHKDGYSTIYWFNSWDANRPTEQARTTIYWSGTEIFEADMRINAANFKYNYGEISTFAEGDVDLESLVSHEIGHVFGLAHNTAKGSSMNAVLNENQVRRKLGQPDLASLKCEY